MKMNVPYLFFLLMLFLITAAFFGLIGSYLMAVFWAIVLALLFHKMHRRIEDRLDGKKNVAAAISLTIIVLVVIIPFLLVGFAIISEGIQIYTEIESGELDLEMYWDFVLDRVPIVIDFLERLSIDTATIQENFQSGVSQLSKVMAGKLIGFTQNIASFFILFFLMIYILYFFLRDGQMLVERLVWGLPIGDKKEWKLLYKFDKVARATVRGSLVVAILQGAVGGLLFWAVGIPAAVLWGVLMTILSLLPLGSSIVWIPASIIFFSMGEFGKGLVVILVGAFVIGLLDNFLRPRLVGSDTKMPDYLVLISTLGGLSWFGVSGFVLGPIITAFFLTCWEILGEEFNENVEVHNLQKPSGPNMDSR